MADRKTKRHHHPDGWFLRFPQSPCHSDPSPISSSPCHSDPSLISSSLCHSDPSPGRGEVEESTPTLWLSPTPPIWPNLPPNHGLYSAKQTQFPKPQNHRNLLCHRDLRQYSAPRRPKKQTQFIAAKPAWGGAKSQTRRGGPDSSPAPQKP